MGKKKKKNKTNNPVDKLKEENKSETNNDLVDMIDKLKEENESIKRKHETCERKIHDLNQIIMLDSIRILEAENDAEASAILCMNVVTELKDKKKNLDHIHEDFNKFTNETSVQITSFQTQLDLKKKVHKLESENKNLKVQISGLNEELKELKNELMESKDRLLSSEIELQKDLTNAMNEATEEIQSLKEEVQSRANECAELNDRNSQLEETTDRLKGQINSWVSKNNSLKDQVKAQTNETKKWKDDCSAKELMITNLMDQNSRLEKELKSSENDFEKSERSWLSTENQLKLQKEPNKLMCKAIQSLKEKLNKYEDLKDKNSQLELEKTSLQKISVKAENEIISQLNKSLEDQVKAPTNETKESRDECSEMKLTNTNLQEQIEEQEAKFEKVESTVNTLLEDSNIKNSSEEKGKDDEDGTSIGEKGLKFYIVHRLHR